MNPQQNKYALLFHASSKDHNADEHSLVFFDSKESLHEKLHELHNLKTLTNQSLLEFAYVFEKNRLYPTDYKTFWNERKIRVPHHLLGDFFIQYQTKQKTLKKRWFFSAEDFDWQFEEWKKKGYTDIHILHTNESLSADYYFEREIQQKWGNKEEPLFA